MSLSKLMLVSYGHFLVVPHSYHHIPYAFQIDVQQALHIPLFRLTFDPSNIASWHFFCYSFLGVCHFLHRVGKTPKESSSFASIYGW